MFDYHYDPAKIVKKDGKFVADAGGSYYLLEFRKNVDHPDLPDEKPKWISICCINKSCWDQTTRLAR